MSLAAGGGRRRGTQRPAWTRRAAEEAVSGGAGPVRRPRAGAGALASPRRCHRLPRAQPARVPPLRTVSLSRRPGSPHASPRVAVGTKRPSAVGGDAWQRGPGWRLLPSRVRGRLGRGRLEALGPLDSLAPHKGQAFLREGGKTKPHLLREVLGKKSAGVAKSLKKGREAACVGYERRDRSSRCVCLQMAERCSRLAPAVSR